VLQIHPDLFKNLSASVDLLPGNDASSISLFTSLVFNINSNTFAHLNPKDEAGCVVITVGRPQGGDLVMYEP
ncbi:hypothetical protein BT96DRAFT_831309, partial [Gymnopus androsaceus JB14]